MFRSIIIIALRTTLRSKTNSIINIAGLAIGFACVILISLYVRDENQYDRFFKSADRIYQVNIDAMMGGQGGLLSNTPPAVGPALKKTFPEIAAYTRFYVMGNEVISNDENSKTQNHFTEKRFLAVDSNFLEVFNYAFKKGSPSTCLQKPYSIVLTETTAARYFGSEDPIGKFLVLDEYKKPFEVTAVLRDIPSQSTIQFDLLIPTAACPPVQRFSWSWVWLQMNTYIIFNKNIPTDPSSIARLVRKFPAMVKVQAAGAFKRIGQPYDEFIKKGGKWDFYLQPLTDVHLYSANIGSQFLTTLGDIKYVYIFSAIAFLIIILACVNFMNLSTAQSIRRAKEVGIRKVLGSVKKQLIRQFLIEAILYSFISTVFALLLVALCLPLFNTVAGKSLQFNSIFQSGMWLFILLLTICTGLLAGCYPAFYLTSFNPVSVLKGGVFKKSLSNKLIRNGLVVFQFSISITLIICTIILFQQLRFSQTKDLGLKKENVIIIPNAEKMTATDEETLRQELMALPGVFHASISTSVPTMKSFGDTYIPNPSDAKEELAKDILLNSFLVDDQFILSLNIQMVEGRNFSKDYNDSASVIVNETAVKQIGWKHPLGQYMTYPGHSDQRFKIIGVIKDFDVESIRNNMSPFALFHYSSKTYYIGTSYIVVSVDPKRIKALLSQFESKWRGFAASVPFEYSFLDKSFEAMYIDEKRMGTVFGIFTSLSIFVACLGLFGLSVYTANSRKKEIGVRKLLGASVQGLVTLLSKEFLKLVFIAAIIAFPISWWAMNKWLLNFAYRISIEWWVFTLAMIMALFIAIFTIGAQATRAAIANPIESLRSE
jgi:putative ABC transport system permease protein